jgi:hypothetical protein
MKSLFLFFLISVVGITACTTDIDPCDEWQNIPVVYGIIDPDDSVHYIRLNRAFLGNMNVYDMASESDSLLYSYDVDVFVHVLNNDNHVVTSLRFEKIRMIKDSFNISGQSIFGIQKHYVYASGGIIPTGQNYTYKLEINFPRGKKVQSTTTGIGNTRHVFPNPLYYDSFSLSPYGNESISLQYYLPSDNGVAQIGFRIYYYEVLSNGAILKKHAHFGLNYFRITSSESNPRLHSYKYYTKDILKKIRKELDSTDTHVIARYLGKIEVRYYVANDDMAEQLYHRVGSLNLDMQIPSNIVGGKGFFASRRHLHVGFRITEASYDNYYQLLPYHKFQPRTAYPDFFLNLPDSLQ